jgi:hypothetical protein
MFKEDLKTIGATHDLTHNITVHIEVSGLQMEPARQSFRDCTLMKVVSQMDTGKGRH